MDVEELYLHSLKQTYELLRNGLPNSVAITLDDLSRHLLKDLLDGAAENVSIVHSKIVRAQAGSSIECSERAQKAKNGMEFTESENDLRFKEPRIQKLSSVKQTIGVGTSGSEDMPKYCRVCQRQKSSVETSTRSVTKTRALSAEGKGKLRSPVSFSKSPGDFEDSESTYLDCISSGSSNKLADVRHNHLTEVTARQNDCCSYLPEQASGDKVDVFSGTRGKGGLSREVSKFQPFLQQEARHKPDASLGSISSKCKSGKISMSSGSEEYYHPPYETQRSRESDMYRSDDESREFSVSGSNESTSFPSYRSRRNSLSSSASFSQGSYSGDGEEGYSPRDKPRFQHHRLPRDGSISTKKMRPRREKNGLWKNIKDKFSSILHHHPHHNHNQKHTDGDGDDDDLSGSENRKAYGKLPLKHIATTSPFLKPDADKRQAVEKIENAVIHGRGNKMLQKPGNALFGGLLKHARAKRLKLLGKHSRFGKSKTSAKLNWLKLLRRHKKAKKLGNGFKKR